MKNKFNNSKPVVFEDYRQCRCGGIGRRFWRENKTIKNFSDNENYEIIQEKFCCLDCGKTWKINVFGNPLTEIK